MVGVTVESKHMNDKDLLILAHISFARDTTWAAFQKIFPDQDFSYSQCSKYDVYEDGSSTTITLFTGFLSYDGFLRYDGVLRYLS